MKALILYWSATSNTEKVAATIEKTLSGEGVDVTMKKIAGAADEDLYAYDLVFLGSPSYQFLPPEPVQKFVRQKMKLHVDRGDIKPGAPRLPGKTAVVFITYSGPHTGIREATPAGEYLGQLFEHIGFGEAVQWYIIGEFHRNEELSTRGRLGDIRGRPNREDLDRVAGDVRRLLAEIKG